MFVIMFQDPPKTPPANNLEDHPVEDLVNDTKDQPQVTVKSTEFETPKGRLVVTTTSEGTDLKKVVLEKNDGTTPPAQPTNEKVDTEKPEQTFRVTVPTLGRTMFSNKYLLFMFFLFFMSICIASHSCRFQSFLVGTQLHYAHPSHVRFPAQAFRSGELG